MESVKVEIISGDIMSADKGYAKLGKKSSSDKDPFRFGNISRRFTLSSRNRAKGSIAKDRFAFEQSMQGDDCKKIRQGGDFVVQKRDFFGNKVGQPITYEVKTEIGRASCRERV
jgi:hypothetical protein